MLKSKIDNYASYKFVSKQVHNAVKNGSLSEREAKEILIEAKKNYRNNSFEREQERLNRIMRKGY